MTECAVARCHEVATETREILGVLRFVCQKHAGIALESEDDFDETAAEL